MSEERNITTYHYIDETPENIIFNGIKYTRVTPTFTHSKSRTIRSGEGGRMNIFTLVLSAMLLIGAFYLGKAHHELSVCELYQRAE